VQKVNRIFVIPTYPNWHQSTISLSGYLKGNQCARKPPFLIEKLEEEAAKEEPRKLRYVLRDLAVAENAFAYEHTG